MTTDINTSSPHRLTARVYGIFFLLAFLTYGGGSAIVAAYADGAEGLAGILANKTVFTIGFILMAVVHTFVNIGLAVVMLSVLKTYNKTVTYGYFSAAIAATLVAVVGAMFMVLLVPLSEAFSNASGDTAYYETLATLLKKGGFYGYQLGMTLWGLGGLMFCYVLYISKLVPRLFPIWGCIGYLVFMTGTIAEMFGHGIGVMLSAPGGLFEISLSLWLIFKGFNTPKSSATYGSRSPSLQV